MLPIKAQEGCSGSAVLAASTNECWNLRVLVIADVGRSILVVLARP